MIDERSTEHARKAERGKKLEEEFQELSHHISRNFVAREVARDAIDLSPPDVDQIKADVGEPVEAV